MAVAAVGWFVTSALRREGMTSPIHRIAVLPMDNQTGDSSQAFFADGIPQMGVPVTTSLGSWKVDR